jgi:iron(III) transport system permease protein
MTILSIMSLSPSRTVLGWSLFGLAAFVLLPWYAQQDPLAWLKAYSQVFGTHESASGATAAAAMSKAWLWLIGAALLACGVSGLAPVSQRARVLVACAALGLVAWLLTGFGIGARGWNFGLEALLPVVKGQLGIGWGGMLTLTAMTVLLGLGIARMGYFRGDGFVAASVVACTMLLLLFIVYPVGKALVGAFLDEGEAFSLSAFGARLFTSRVFGLGCLQGARCGVAWNTLFLGLMTATSTTFLGAVLALMAERALVDKAGRKIGWADKSLQFLALLPVITPPFVVGLGLILLFGRAGLVNQALEWAFGIAPSRWFYGVQGVWLAQTFAFTPIAFLIVRGVVQGISPSLEEAAQTLRANRAKTFFTVTLPLLKPGLANAFLVGFIESLADFGNPIVLGGQYAVLSTEIFFAIVGAQLDQGRAAALGMLLTGFALTVFLLQRFVLGKANYTTVSGKGDNGLPLPLPVGVRRMVFGIGLPWLAFTLVVYVFAILGGFVKTWGRDHTLTLEHYIKVFDVQWGVDGIVWAGSAWNSFWTTLKLSAFSAPITAAVGLLMAFLIARTQFRGQSAFEFATLLAFAIPGTVVGVSYILAFNVPPFELTGTALIIVLCFLFRNLPVGVRAGVAAFKQLDKSLDEASIMLGASTPVTLRRVVLPLLRPAMVAALVYSFVRATTTVSAVIFLVTAENELATTFIIGRVGNGDYGGALAYCTVLMILMMVAIGLIQLLVGERKMGKRS